MDGGRRGRARTWWRGALTAALLLLVPAASRAQSAECDPGEREVRSLTFRGNHAYRSNELALRVATTPSSFWRRTLRVFGKRRCLDSDELRLDVGRLRLFYNRHGYYSAAVDTSVVANADSSVRSSRHGRNCSGGGISRRAVPPRWSTCVAGYRGRSRPIRSGWR